MGMFRSKVSIGVPEPTAPILLKSTSLTNNYEVLFQIFANECMLRHLSKQSSPGSLDRRAAKRPLDRYVCLNYPPRYRR